MRNILFYLIIYVLIPMRAFACACGCGVFGVGTASMLPDSAGGIAWLEYDFMNQEINWSRNSPAPETVNEDKRIRTQFYTAGMQYMFNRSWGAAVEVPYGNRYFRTGDDPENTVGIQHSALGDVRLKGVYSGFSSDMSSGLTFGVKLPTGDHHFEGFDRDTDIGTGSTDILLGAYHRGRIAYDPQWNWYVNGVYQYAVLTQGQYRPGDDFNAALGVYYTMQGAGEWGKISPLLQLLGSVRAQDRGANANPDNSGYTRLMVAPGMEYNLHALKLYADVELPFYQHVNGNQLTAPLFYKFIIGYQF